MILTYSVSSWHTFHNDLQRTGFTTLDGPMHNTVLWTFSTGGTIYSSPALAHGYVYVGSGDGQLYCINEETGDEVWSFTTGGKVESSPTITDTAVYFCSNDGNIYCYLVIHR